LGTFLEAWEASQILVQGNDSAFSYVFLAKICSGHSKKNKIPPSIKMPILNLNHHVSHEKLE
jgi:hypothetical protein